MVEEGDLDDKLEDKATNEVVDDVKKVAMEGVDIEKKQVAMKVANTNCLDDPIDDAPLLLFFLLYLLTLLCLCARSNPLKHSLNTGFGATSKYLPVHPRARES